jgi:uncharacterized membrane protein YoaK (UPF0700 family)
VRSAERDVMLFVLAASAGSADGFSYFGLGHAFVANMTGNTVLLGVAVFQNHGDMVRPAIALASYAVGAVLGSLLTGDIPSEAVWSKAISWTLMAESLLLSGAQVGWVAIHVHPSNPVSLYLNALLACVAVAIGMQSSAMLRLKVPGIVTTYITGTWTTLMSGLVRLAKHEPQQGHQLEFEKRLLMQASVLSVYFLSAVLTGWLFRHLPLAVGALPSLCVFFVAVYGALRGRDA